MYRDIDTIFKIIKRFSANPDSDGATQVSLSSQLTQEELMTIIGALDRVAPRFITSLEPGEVFVFGSNEQGIHDERASKVAKDYFGAVSGEGEGLFGNSYAIPTTRCEGANDERISYSVDEIRPHVDRFIETASANRDRVFYVTRIACGCSGYSDEDIAPLFAEALKLRNVHLPQSFLDVLFYVKPSTDNPSDLVPVTPSGKGSFEKDLEVQLSTYLAIIRSRYRVDKESAPEQYARYTAVIDAAEVICNSIIDAVDRTFRGLPAAAFASLSKALNEKVFCSEWGIGFTDIEKGKSFYRMRNEPDNLVKKNVDARGMFHIPISRRSFIKTQRYSVPGYPCLYLGEHVFGCWEEMGRPNLSNCLISRLVNTESFKVLDLRIPESAAWDVKDGELPVQTILMFPFIIACTFRQSTPSAVFKPEYIIPQILLQYVKEYAYKQNLGKEKKDRTVYGIKYTSVHIDKAGKEGRNDFCPEKDAFDNYVIPVLGIRSELCSKLTKVFKISDPICEEFEKGKSWRAGKQTSSMTVFESLESALLSIKDTDLKDLS